MENGSRSFLDQEMLLMCAGYFRVAVKKVFHNPVEEHISVDVLTCKASK